MIQDKIKQDLIAALKGKRTAEVSVLRGIISQVLNKEIDKKEKLTNEEVVQILRKEIKTLEEANKAFLEGGREDLVDKNLVEINILKTYLPQEVSDKELRQKVKEIIERNSEEQNMGKMIGRVVAELKSVAESGRIAQVVREVMSAN
jgi:uncharacterized protein YqeY